MAKVRGRAWAWAWAWAWAAVPACGPGSMAERDGDAATDVTAEADADEEIGADADADGETEAEAEAAGEDGTTEDAGRRPYGDPCTNGDECVGRFCIDASLDPSFVGGYCSALFCDVTFPGACGTEALCFDTEVYPPLCAKTCETDADCRPPDYVCVGTCIPDDFTAPLDRPGILTGAETEVTGFLAAVDDDRMMRRVRVLAGEEAWDGPTGPVTIRSRADAHPDHELAADYLEAELTGLGWTVERLEFGAGLTNLEAEIPGTDAGLAPVLVTAHWDSTATDTTGWDAAADAAPGAVDNASGVAVALEVATILADAGTTPPARTVRIVLFDAEETGLQGSEDFVAGLTGDIACAVNTDMIGWTTEPTAGRFWYVFDEGSRPWAELGVEAIDLFVPGARPLTTDYGDAGYSDSASFWAAGRCAVGVNCWPRELSNHSVDDTSAAFEPIFHDVARASIAVAAGWMYGGGGL
ncbi:MAG: M20/M25/M40 family metallo-hydrolase [Deltaproteobacteria bacterium]|nr:M20/M25/M40 family metallo-hydrolase [Deltaproteobacteria bacterium]